MMKGLLDGGEARQGMDQDLKTKGNGWLKPRKQRKVKLTHVFGNSKDSSTIVVVVRKREDGGTTVMIFSH